MSEQPPEVPVEDPTEVAAAQVLLTGANDPSG